MIRITPIDDSQRSNRQEIREYYFNLLAEVVPFLPEDVLGDIPSAYKGIGMEPRKRTLAYKLLLMKYGIPTNGNKVERRIHDAELAERLIGAYSTKIHDLLYEKTKSRGGAVKSSQVLQDYFTTKFPNGVVPEVLKLDKEDNPSQEIKDNLLKYVFCYEDFSRIKTVENINKNGSKLDIYQFVSMIGVPVCPYCNRQFTSTVVDGEKRIRPQLDHFKSKKDYPHLALCINNLIPCCAICNLLKHDDELKILYPYDEGIDNSYVFRAEIDKKDIISLLTGTEKAIDRFELKLEKNNQIPEDDHTCRADASVTKFALNKLYLSHKDYVADLFRQSYIFTDQLCEHFATQFPELFKSKEDVKHRMRLMNYSPDKWGERPLAKLTHDIANQIDKLREDDSILNREDID